MNSTSTITSARPWILVLLPVYNGSRYLRPQLDSILGQSHERLLIVCRDDGSKDESRAIVAEYQARDPQRVLVVDDQLGNLGARGSFSRLMEIALEVSQQDPCKGTPCYFALADQDDTWHPHKLEKLLEAMRRLEQGDPSTPALVHGDLRVVDQDGQEIAPSMAGYQGLRPDRDSLAAQLISNTVTGCTAMMNRSLVERCTPVPAESIMHDWWISLVASAFGRRQYLQEALVNYRQHGNNTIGAKAWTERNRYRMKAGLAALPKNIYHVLRVLVIIAIRMWDDEHNEAFQGNARQARAFLRQFGNQLSIRDRFKTRMACWLSVHFPPLQRVLFRLLRQL